MKGLIITAANFGLDTKVNNEILGLIDDGRISGTSVLIDRLMVNGNREYAAYLGKMLFWSGVSSGLHLEFDTPDEINDFERNFYFLEQVKDQMVRFSSLFGSDPDFLDVHKSKYNPESQRVLALKSSDYKIPHANYGGQKSLTTDSKRLVGSVNDFSVLDEFLFNMKDGSTYEMVFYPSSKPHDSENIRLLNNQLKKYSIEKISYKDLNK